MALSMAELTQQITTLILNPGTRAWERQLLVGAKQRLTPNTTAARELSRLLADLRPLAQRQNLTPAVADFYRQMTGETVLDSRDLVAQHTAPDPPYQERAVFAGGCFWCMVEPFETRPGINAVISGYTGGTVAQPTYDQFISQSTGHVEAVEILFDTRQVTYADLLTVYWQLIDPTDDSGQVNDRGESYRPIIFVNSAAQRQLAEASKQRVIDQRQYQKPIVVAIEPTTTFWPAENYHQQFYRQQPKRYQRLERARQRYLRWQRLWAKWRRK